MLRRSLRFEPLEDRSMLSVLAGTVFNDADSSGTREAGEMGLADWTTYLDQSGDAALNDSQTTKVASTPATIPEITTVYSSLAVTGIVGNITDLNVGLNITGVRASSLTITLMSPAGTSVVLANHSGGTGVGFVGTTLDDEAIAMIANSTAPFTGRFVPLAALSAFDGQDPNGTWQLVIQSNSYGAGVGTLQNWSLEVSVPEPTATTDANGDYYFEVPAGSYTVRAVAQPNWFQISPSAPDYFLRTVGAGSTSDGLDFAFRFARPQQIIGVEGTDLTAMAGGDIAVPIIYDVSNGDATLPGIGVRVHFDSTLLTFVETANLAPNLFQSQTPVADTADYDGDSATDQYVLVGWFDWAGQWPGAVPATLATCSFTVATGVTGTTTAINFSAASHAAGFGFTGYPVTYQIMAVNLDVDGNGTADALTDGILIVRYLFDRAGDWPVDDAVAPGAPRATKSAILTYLDEARGTILDVDGDGSADAMSDGVLMMRYLLEREAPWDVSDAVSEGATRRTHGELKLFLDAAAIGV